MKHEVFFVFLAFFNRVFTVGQKMQRCTLLKIMLISGSLNVIQSCGKRWSSKYNPVWVISMMNCDEWNPEAANTWNLHREIHWTFSSASFMNQSFLAQRYTYNSWESSAPFHIRGIMRWHLFPLFLAKTVISGHQHITLVWTCHLLEVFLGNSWWRMLYWQRYGQKCKFIYSSFGE